MQWQKPLDPNVPEIFRVDFVNRLNTGETLVSGTAVSDAAELLIAPVTVDGSQLRLPLSIAAPSVSLDIWDYGGKVFEVEVVATTSAARQLPVTVLLAVRNL